MSSRFPAATPRLTALLGSRIGRASANGDNPMLPTMLVAVCKMGGVCYTQSEDADGTFSVSRFDISPHGLTTAALRFDPKELTKADIGTFFVPHSKTRRRSVRSLRTTRSDASVSRPGT